MMKRVLTALTVFLTAFLFFGPIKANAQDTDRIHEYEITVDVLDDGKLYMNYHLEWEVLESDGIGPVEWVNIGIPNAAVDDYFALSDNIDYMFIDGGYDITAEIHFTDSYYEGEVIEFDFGIVQGNMYAMNDIKDGETRYTFTPGWFNDINVDNLTIRWNMDKALMQTPACKMESGYYVWNESLPKGSTFTIYVSYPNSAFNFDEGWMDEEYYSDYYDDYYDDNYYYEDEDDGEAVLGFFVLCTIIFIAIVKKNSVSRAYNSGSGFGTTKTTTTKVTRTLVKYYPTCQGCGATREENQEKCAYCGRSFIESEETITEEKVKEPEKYKTEGTYRYSDAPNTYIRVHVTPVVVSTPRPRPSCAHSSCAHSSCAHSSCACASHCACACACACAGGGRAGCSTKDFYNTNLKLRHLEPKKK